MTNWYQCLNCNHQFKARDRNVPNRQCADCRSTRLEEIASPDFSRTSISGHQAKDLFHVFDKSFPNDGNNMLTGIVREYSTEPTAVRYAFMEWLALKRLEAKDKEKYITRFFEEESNDQMIEDLDNMINKSPPSSTIQKYLRTKFQKRPMTIDELIRGY